MFRFITTSRFSPRARSCHGMILAGIMLLLQGCGPTQIAFGVKHIRDSTGQQITEVASYDQYPGLDNTNGTTPLQVQLEFKRPFTYKISVLNLDKSVPEQQVRQKIVELYKLPPNSPEDTPQNAQCPIVVVIPEGQKAKVTIEWTERWAEGVVNEGDQAQGNRLGTFKVFLGYLEPCSLVKQDNSK